MEELDLQERQGVFTRLKGLFGGEAEYVEEEGYEEAVESKPQPSFRVHARGTYTVTIRRVVQSFQDAVAAADGLKRGEQQILNLSACDQTLREKIKDFMCGVNYSQEGAWEELGENVFLLAPSNAIVEVAPAAASARMTAGRN